MKGKELKRDGQNIFEIVLSSNRVTRKEIEKNEKIYDTIDTKEHLLYEEKLVKLLKGLKIIRSQVMTVF